MFRTIFAGTPRGLMHAVFTHDNHDVSPVTNAFSGAESFTADSVIMSEHGRLWLDSLSETRIIKCMASVMTHNRTQQRKSGQSLTVVGGGQSPHPCNLENWPRDLSLYGLH
jgi:lysine/ornithine N-monooxygenase